MTISSDSPEAFEEIFWRHFWPRHYLPDRILPWARCDDESFLRFFRQHMRKIIAVRRGRGGNAALPDRYVSKNNANIARLSALADAMPDASIIVPFRDPLQHAVSLWRQHCRFVAIHEADAFARRYMAGIGHYDFGAHLRPINFRNWLRDRGGAGPADLSFWLRYWIAAYSAILDQCSDRILLLSYDALCQQPHEQLQRLAAAIGLTDAAALLAKADSIDPPSRREVDTSTLDPADVAHANDLAAKLRAAAI